MQQDNKVVLKGKVVLLNCPKSGGKDTIANRLVSLTGATKAQFKDHLYLITSVLFNVKLSEFIQVATDTKLKEEPHNALGGLSPRQALIGVSEKMVKPFFGNAYFGNAEATKLEGRLKTGVVYSDSGFIEEAEPLIKMAGIENVFVIKFTRKGADSFEGDSRNWLPDLPGLKVLKTTNNGTVNELAERIISFVQRDGKPLH